ncbi:MAG: outer membrane protein assembly factor BamE domain-containing protein [Leptospirales bacterium]
MSPMSLANLHEGKSTMADVRRILGKPDKIKFLLGDQTWIYQHTRTTGWFSQNTKVNKVWILFSSEGIVRKIRSQKYVGDQFF